MNLGIITPRNVGIGDAIQYGCVPENYHRNTGKKIIDLSRSFVFDYNPFVSRDQDADEVVDLWNHEFKPGYHFLSKSERWCNGLGLKKCYLRHPRLYIHENIGYRDFAPTISVHCSGKTRGHLSDRVIEVIQNKYRDFRIFQIGGEKDRKTPFTDKRGLPFFESAKIIAESSVFIGIDSAMYHVARCYPQVRRKVIIQNDHFNEEQLLKFRPYKEGFDDWIDYDTEYFNEFDYDVGITNSLYKI